MRLLTANGLRLVLVTWLGFGAVGAFESFDDHSWLEAIGIGIGVGVYYGTIAVATMVPAAIVHWLCFRALATRTANVRWLRGLAIGLSPLLALGVYFAFRASQSPGERRQLLALALALSVAYGAIARLPGEPPGPPLASDAAS